MTEAEEKAGETKVTFGKYKDSSLWWILDEDPSYFDWMLNTIKTERDTIPGYFIKDLHLYGNSDTVQTQLELLL